MQIMSVVGSSYKYIFNNKEKKTFKKIYMDDAFGNNQYSDFSMNNAYLGILIISIISIAIFILEKLSNYY